MFAWTTLPKTCKMHRTTKWQIAKWKCSIFSVLMRLDALPAHQLSSSLLEIKWWWCIWRHPVAKACTHAAMTPGPRDQPVNVRATWAGCPCQTRGVTEFVDGSKGSIPSTKAHRNYLKESRENIFNIPVIMHSLGNHLNKPIKRDASASRVPLHYARNKLLQMAEFK